MGRRPPARKPSFMQILLKDFSNKLLIPPKFVRLHRTTLARNCILRPTGTQDSWRVRTKQINNLLYFNEGWEKFAQHHTLGFGDFLVFRYAQDCEFYVDMFDKSCCNKEPLTSHNVGSLKDTTPILPSQEKKANLKTPAIDAAEELMASSKFPAFKKVMQRVDLKAGRYLPVVSDFAKTHLKGNIREVRIEVSGKTWTVGVAREGCSCRLSRCWGYLAKEHALKAGENQKSQTRAGSGKVHEAQSRQAVEAQSSKAVEGQSSQTLEAPSSYALETHSNRTIESAYKYSSLSKYPSYPCLMSSSYIRKSYLYVPSTFVKQMNAKAGGIKVKLQCWGKEWDAVVSTYGTVSVINNGWSTFTKKNSLQIGDCCVFELINRKDALIRVTIFKRTN
ncbi:hypothetical protein POM88_029553 [Heracleum sosnowskyi]|uniref:TF-B3 domain-containing protein n=1 Tax=Heracleum sosnowskyi TaxID=360622 RepID=A0AAD8HWQ5_9APIA|nr:hypothetical protein POM88_029553 [Heracleum sosnowskyi]